MTAMIAAAGIYVIEVSHGVIKVGQSADTDRRISTHIRNARGLGADPYRYAVVPCPAELLREAEKAAHDAVKTMGGSAQARTPEVFTGVYYNPVLYTVQNAVNGVVEHANALARIKAATPEQLDARLAGVDPDVALVVRRLAATPT